MKRVAVLGAGAWGTALAIVLAPRLPTTLWARDPAQARVLDEARRNERYLPGIDLPPGLALTAELSRAAQADLLVIATPMAGLRPTLRAALDASPARRPGVVWLCKGFEAGTGCLPHEVAAQVLPDDVRRGALSGPSFAEEVARGLPCALTLASHDEPFAREAAALLHGGRMRVYYSGDLTGVEVGGAVKNVMAIAAGICDGLALGQNARAALITRGLAEIRRLGVALGGEPDTFMGLSGAGDLILTTTGDLSRNRRVGLELAHGHALAGILERLGHVAEGVHTTREVARIAAERGVEMPVTAAVHAVLEGRLTAAAAVERLLSRDPRSER